MILIAHRGNLTGPNLKDQNKPDYIKKALKAGYNVELDLWRLGKKLYLGHDSADHYIQPKFLYSTGLWIHAKNIEALEWLTSKGKVLNYFWHQEDKFALTSQGRIWAYPSSTVYKKAINVMPENNKLTPKDLKGVYGVCSDSISEYRV